MSEEVRSEESLNPKVTILSLTLKLFRVFFLLFWKIKFNVVEHIGFPFVPHDIVHTFSCNHLYPLLSLTFFQPRYINLWRLRVTGGEGGGGVGKSHIRWRGNWPNGISKVHGVFLWATVWVECGVKFVSGHSIRVYAGALNFNTNCLGLCITWVNSVDCCRWILSIIVGRMGFHIKSSLASLMSFKIVMLDDWVEFTALHQQITQFHG